MYKFVEIIMDSNVVTYKVYKDNIQGSYESLISLLKQLQDNTYEYSCVFSDCFQEYEKNKNEASIKIKSLNCTKFDKKEDIIKFIINEYAQELLWILN